MDRLSLAGDQRHTVLALGHQHGFAVGEIHRILRGGGNAFVAVGAAAGGLGKFLAVRR